MRFIKIKLAAAMLGWHHRHLMRAATQPEFAHYKLPKLVRLGDNTAVFVLEELEAWMEARVAERDEQGYVPKDRNPHENHQRALERKQRDKLRSIRETVEGGDAR
jgi:predicted DNA-binding transcriptional regulator AlpA